MDAIVNLEWTDIGTVFELHLGNCEFEIGSIFKVLQLEISNSSSMFY